jgi:AbrB family looped-hinge helix DNA binding protein
MKRKLIKQGGSGLTIYIPKKWIDRLNLKPGDELDVDEEGNQLILSPDEFRSDKEISINTTHMSNKSVILALNSAYWHGYNLIELVNEKNFSFVEINKLVDSYIGLVTLEQEDNKILIKNVMSEKAEDVNKVINKIFITLGFLMKKALEKKPNHEELLELRNSVFRLSNYAQRLIFANHYGKDKTYAHNILIFCLKKISTPFIHLDSKANKEILAKIIDWFEKIRLSFVKSDLNLATKTFEEVSKARNELLKHKKEEIGTTIIVEHLFSLSSRTIAVLI